MQLVSAHIDSVNYCRMPLQKHLGEAPCRSACIEAHTPFRAQAKMIEARDKLPSTSRNIASRIKDFYRRVRSNGNSRFGRDVMPNAHGAAPD